jgi:putative spermidine/putrescine transport system substrate-binding protein
LSTEVQTALATKLVDSPANKEVKVPDDVANNITYGENTAKSLKLIPSAEALDQRDTWVKEWNETVGQ